MEPAELLAQFRALGGIADNVCIRPCQQGHGLFAVDPALAVRVRTPAHLLIAPELLAWTATGQVRVHAASGQSPAVTAFHESYQRSVGWSAGGCARTSQFRQQLCALPDRLKGFLRLWGFADALNRAPAPLEVFQSYCISRQIRFQGASRLMPVLELINHAHDGAPYVVTHEAVGLSGRFADEVLARYRQHMDAFHFFFNYHFATPCRSVLSCEVRIDLPLARSLRISRLDGLSEMRSGVHMPQLSTRKNEIHLSYVELVNLEAPALPRQVFLALLMAQGLSGSSAQELFDGLLQHNRQVLQDFLQASEGAEGQVIQDLRAVAGQQLESLSGCPS
jgi:hypothetical protein